MSRNCLVTINIHGFLTRYSRRSFVSACERWGCDFAEVHQVLKRSCPSCSKYLVPGLFSGYDKIMLLDADTVISPHTPDPFTLCDRDNVLHVVSDFHGINDSDAWKEGPYQHGMMHALRCKPLFIAPKHQDFFNSGMWICRPSPAIIDLFNSAAEVLPDNCDLWVEQGTINAFAHNSDYVKVEILPETWNHIIPPGCSPVPEYYINHFGGWAHDMLKELSDSCV